MIKSKFNKHLEKFKDIHIGESAIMIATGNSFIDKWSGKPDFPEYKDSIKFTMNRMIYLNPEVADECDYYFCGSGLNTRTLDAWEKRTQVRINLREMVFEYCSRTPNCIKFGSCYEDGQSHKIIDRGNLWPEHAIENGIIPFENTLFHFTDDIANYCTLGHSVVFPCMQFMLYMGFSTIYLLGVDGGGTLPEFPNSGFEHHMDWWKKFHQWYKGDTKIVSINPIDLKEMFEYVNI